MHERTFALSLTGLLDQHLYGRLNINCSTAKAYLLNFKHHVIYTSLFTELEKLHQQ